jgi:hypothetical protein
MKSVLGVCALAIALCVVAAAVAAPRLQLAIKSSTARTVTFVWTPPAGATGYTFWVGGKRVSATQDGTRSAVKFARASCDGKGGCYEVRARTVLAVGSSSGRQGVQGPTRETITPSQFAQRVSTGTTISNVTVTGSVSIGAPNVTLEDSEIQGTINLPSSAQHVTIRDTAAVDFVAHGADYVTLDGDTLDGGPGKSCQNFIWPGANRDPATHWQITNSTFRNYQCEDPHSEALYIASDAAFGLIQGNIFINNGSTSHIFFTWCNDLGGNENLCAAYGQGNGAPHDWSVRDNTFLDTWRAYYAVSIREELVGVPTLRICVDNHQRVTGPIIEPPDYGGALAEFIVPWGAGLLRPSCPDPS